MIWSLRVPSVVLQPSPQCVQMVPTWVHLPRPRLIAVDAAGERADGADVDAGAALVAFQVVALVRRDFARRRRG